jgi:large subunit ribosomal protein L31e
MIMTEEIEKIFVIPLKIRGYVSSNAAPVAMKRVKTYLMKHMKTSAENIWIDESLNNEIWKHGKFKMQNKIRVKAVKFDDGVVEAYLPELTFEKSRREIIQEEKSKKQPILRKEQETEEETVEDEAGASEYDVVPAADGDVKIKKKKQPKEQVTSEVTEKELKEIEEPPVEKVEEPKEKPVQKKPSQKKVTEKEPSEKKEKKAPAKKTKKESK